jgi:excisionase family DNA binding protein
MTAHPTQVPTATDDLWAFSFAQVGERLGVSESTIRRMVRAGQLRTVPVWGKPRVLPSELRRYLDQLDTPIRAQRRLQRRA